MGVVGNPFRKDKPMKVAIVALSLALFGLPSAAYALGPVIPPPAPKCPYVGQYAVWTGYAWICLPRR